MEDAVAPEGADGQSLRVVLEGIGRWLGAVVVDSESLVELDEGEGGVGAFALDAAGLDVAGDAQILAVGAVAHALELGDGDVIALGLAAGRDGEPDDDGNDEGAGDDELEGRALLLDGHLALVYRGSPHSHVTSITVFRGVELSAISVESGCVTLITGKPGRRAYDLSPEDLRC